MCRGIFRILFRILLMKHVEDIQEATIFIFSLPDVEFYQGRPQAGIEIKNPKYDLFIPNFIHFII